MRVLRGALLGAISVLTGIGAVWTQEMFSIPKDVVQMVWLGSLLAALFFAAWAAWDYYRALRDDDHWD
jgi:hypothetical protein